VGYRTVARTAVAGIDFTSVTGTLEFADGQSSRQIFIPTLANTATTGDRTFEIVLSGQGQGELGSPSRATVTLVDLDKDEVAPRLAAVKFTGTSALMNTVLVSFNEAMATSRATNKANYVIQPINDSGVPGAAIAIVSAGYNPSTRTVSIVPRSPLRSNTTYQIRVLASPAGTGLTDASGNLLDGNSDGKAGGDFTATFVRSNEVFYTDADGDLVNLKLSRGGYMDVVRGLPGDALSVRVGGIRQGVTTISGSVIKGPRGNGRTNLGDIEGIGAFRNGAISLLTTPPFTSNDILPTAESARRLAVRRAGFPVATPRLRG
jgi:hypothetical protein